MANSDRRNNNIESLMVNGTACLIIIIIFYHSEIREHIVQFYNSLFIEQFRWWPKLVGLSFESIGEVEVEVRESV
jgi:hypothetical protein